MSKRDQNSKVKAKPRLNVNSASKAIYKDGIYYKTDKKVKGADYWEIGEKKQQYPSSTSVKNVWQIQEAKAMFCELVKAAQDKPQVITVHGKKTAVLISYDEYKKDKKPKMTGWEFMKKARLYGVELDIEPRRWEPDRDINL